MQKQLYLYIYILNEVQQTIFLDSLASDICFMEYKVSNFLNHHYYYRIQWLSDTFRIHDSESKRKFLFKLPLVKFSNQDVCEMRCNKNYYKIVTDNLLLLWKRIPNISYVMTLSSFLPL